MVEIQIIQKGVYCAASLSKCENNVFFCLLVNSTPNLQIIERDKLIATTAARHYIPTPNIPQGRAITLKNYRIPEAQKEEVESHIQKSFQDEIITPNQRNEIFSFQRN